ncbi:MAG: DUF892 family protein [Chitinophagaceae bacterium]|nr:DUF892 family protein [Chitinophagaceae bacterium]MBL0055575.1 DUF892 family protein [Chitinophagaceae bacterium]
MPETVNRIATLHNLLDHDARKFTSAEIQLKNSLEDWISKAISLKLKSIIQKYHAIVKDHVQLFEEFFESEQILSLNLNNRVMHAFIEEVNEKQKLCSDAATRDACLIAGIQAINHFKISTYGTAAAFARTLGMEKEAALFHQAEVNEKQIDDRLTQLAEFEVNAKAKTPIELHA